MKLSEKWIKGEIFYRALDVEDVKEAVEKLKKEIIRALVFGVDKKIAILNIDKIFGEFK